MTEKRLVYSIEGDPTSIKKAFADAQAAHQKLVADLSRQRGDIAAFKSAQEGLVKLNAALAEAKRQRDFFLNSASAGGASGTKLFAGDIARAKQEVLNLAAAAQRQQATLATLSQSLKTAGIDTHNLSIADARLAIQMRAADSAMSVRVGGLQRAALAQQRTFDQLRSRVDEVRVASSRLRGVFGQLAGAFVAGLSVRGLAQAADGYANLQARLKLAARSQEEFAASNDAIQRIARAAQAPLAETAALYTRIANSLKDTDVSQSQFVDTTEAVALALRISGAAVSESQSGMLQFSQAIASGVLRGEEFNAIAENAPRLMQALAASLGKPVGELRAMAKEGQLTREVLINGLAAELPKLRREAESLPKTLSGAFTELGNSLLLTVGQIDQATGASASFAKSLLDLGKPVIRVVFETLAVLGANVAFVFKTVGREIGAYAAQIAAILRLDFKGARFIRDAVTDDSKAARAELDALEKKIFGLGTAKAVTPPVTGKGTPAPTAPNKPDKSAVSAAKREAEALLAAQAALEKARLEAAAQGLEDSLTMRSEKLDQARKAELIDDAGFIAAKAALAEEGLRNELAALQDQQAKLRAASNAPGAKGSDRTNALAELTLIEARIQSAGDKIFNLNQAATADLAALALTQMKLQAEFIDGLEQEAFLSRLNNDERETALLLLEAEKIGVADINRLLQLRAEIRSNTDAKQAADELKKQQDSLYASVQQGVQRAFADGLNAVATGEGGVAGALKNLSDTIRNVMSNALAGSLTDQFLGLFGGKEGVLNIAGTLGFGGKKDGSSPTSALYVQDVGAGGLGALTGAKGGEGVLGDTSSLFGGLFESIKNIFSGIGSTISSLFKSLASSISGLFSSSGGGGGSSAGGLISSLISIFAGSGGSSASFADGGYTGAGGKYQPAGVVHAGEYVFSADSVRRLGLDALDNMHRIASGSFLPRAPRLGYAEGGLVNLPSAAAPTIVNSMRVVNHVNLEDAMSEYLNTRSGERAVLNIIQRNPGAVDK